MITRANGFDLHMERLFPDGRRYAFVCIALLVFLLVIYSNSFRGAWQFDDTPNIEGNRETKLKLSRTVKETCLRMLEDCDIIVALVDDGDTGVAFEAGYAHAINIPIILVSKANCDEANAMLIGAARERIDNILQEEQIGKLARMFEWYYISKERYSHEPGKN
jgi:hypothetical protein